MKLRTFSLALLFFQLTVVQAYAEPLPLSDHQMQKLKHLFPADSDAPPIIWQGNPILIQLSLNQEKRLVFPAHVLFDAKGALATDQLRVINNDRSLYLTALKPINNTRVYITLQDSNEVILMDLATGNNVTNETAYIDIQPIHNTISATQDTLPAISENDAYVTLTRFAWQQLYAPERLINNTPGIVRAPMRTEPLLSTLLYGDKVIAHPVSSWRYNDRYITAVELRNKYPHATTLKANRDLCGDWQTATFYPRTRLKPAGDKTGDSTTLFLISTKPFGDSMEVCNASA